MKRTLKRIKRELRYQGTILNMYCDTMELPGGKIEEWDFLDHKGAAAVVPVTADGKILMVRQYRNALERETLEVPAGALDTRQEDGKVCAMRELTEETGFSAKEEDVEWLMNLRTTVAFCNEKIQVFVARNLTPGEQMLDEAEEIELEEYTLEELKEKIYSGEIEDSKTVASLLAYEAKYCRGK